MWTNFRFFEYPEAKPEDMKVHTLLAVQRTTKPLSPPPSPQSPSCSGFASGGREPIWRVATYSSRYSVDPPLLPQWRRLILRRERAFFPSSSRRLLLSLRNLQPPPPLHFPIFIKTFYLSSDDKAGKLKSRHVEAQELSQERAGGG